MHERETIRFAFTPCNLEFRERKGSWKGIIRDWEAGQEARVRYGGVRVWQ